MIDRTIIFCNYRIIIKTLRHCVLKCTLTTKFYSLNYFTSTDYYCVANE